MQSEEAEAHRPTKRLLTFENRRIQRICLFSFNQIWLKEQKFLLIFR